MSMNEAARESFRAVLETEGEPLEVVNPDGVVTEILALIARTHSGRGDRDYGARQTGERVTVMAEDLATLGMPVGDDVRAWSAMRGGVRRKLRSAQWADMARATVRLDISLEEFT
ncbi:MAG: hypothetical protein AAF713_20610 [Pseudomonadota bacterium]